MVRRRAIAVGIGTAIGNHPFRASLGRMQLNDHRALVILYEDAQYLQPVTFRCAGFRVLTDKRRHLCQRGPIVIISMQRSNNHFGAQGAQPTQRHRPPGESTCVPAQASPEKAGFFLCQEKPEKPRRLGFTRRFGRKSPGQTFSFLHPFPLVWIRCRLAPRLNRPHQAQSHFRHRLHSHRLFSR